MHAAKAIYKINYICFYFIVQMNVCLLIWLSGLLHLICRHTKTITVESFAIIAMPVMMVYKQ